MQEWAQLSIEDICAKSTQPAFRTHVAIKWVAGHQLQLAAGNDALLTLAGKAQELARHIAAAIPEDAQFAFAEVAVHLGTCVVAGDLGHRRASSSSLPVYERSITELIKAAMKKAEEVSVEEVAIVDSKSAESCREKQLGIADE
eukprot:scaffold2702_cov317-Pinguiococcus_pyrenoidosus.AAC.1